MRNNNAKPVKVVVLVICIVQLAVGCISPPPRLRQQLVDAKKVPLILARFSAAP